MDRDLKIEAWQERSPIERRSDQDKRKKNSNKNFGGGLERRTGTERRDTAERRERWLRVGKWRSESKMFGTRSDNYQNSKQLISCSSYDTTQPMPVVGMRYPATNHAGPT